MSFDDIEKIAAAILYEGYILYPYRKSAIKNRQRWNFGTLYPRIYAEHQRPQERFQLIAEVLCSTGMGSQLDLRFSFLQLVRQEASNGLHELSDPSLAWEEAVEFKSDHNGIKLSDLMSTPWELDLHFKGATLPEGRGRTQGRDLEGHLSINATALPDGSCKLRLELQNTSALPGAADARRDEALPQSFVSAHVMLGLNGGEFISLLDPPSRYRASVASCNSIGVFPVLAGEEPSRDLMFCSPIILYDYPKIALESEGDFFDGTEMDEMLTLRVLTLTDEEKDEMRLGDPRARRILERTESLTGEAMLKAHGVVRSLRPVDGGPL